MLLPRYHDNRNTAPFSHSSACKRPTCLSLFSLDFRSLGCVFSSRSYMLVVFCAYSLSQPTYLLVVLVTVVVFFFFILVHWSVRLVFRHDSKSPVVFHCFSKVGGGGVSEVFVCLFFIAATGTASLILHITHAMMNIGLDLLFFVFCFPFFPRDGLGLEMVLLRPRGKGQGILMSRERGRY